MVLLTSSARTATTNSPDQHAYADNRGVRLYLDVTANPGGTETLTVSVEAKDPASDKWKQVAAFPATTAATNSHYEYELYPGASGTNKVGGSLPRAWRVKVTHSASGSWTYSVGAHLVP